MTELTLMAVHAHPDDESSSTGGVLARYSAEGVRTVVVTCTNGELGDGPDHVKPDEDGHDPAAVAELRMGELRSAASALGISFLEPLGYHDSGMADWDHKGRQDVFCNTPLEESSARLVSLFEEYRPQVVVTYDERGGYLHPDHIRAHELTMAAVAATDIPDKVYFTARGRADRQRMRELMAERGIEMPAPPELAPDPERDQRMADAEARITTTVDISEFAPQKLDALTAHASQLDRSFWVRVPRDASGLMFAHERFIRFMDKTGAPLPEADLFAGLR